MSWAASASGETPDGRPGVRVLLFGFSPEALAPQLKNRVGQCVLTSPGSACYAGVDAKRRIVLGQGPRYFGDGFQTAKILGNDRAGLLASAEAAVAAIGEVPDVITPFPGGIVRSGSKVGSKYKGMVASTNDAFCPTLRGRVKSELGPDTVAVLEIVIDGLSSKAVADAMKAALRSLIEVGPSKGVTRISAGNYGGKLGQHHYHLRELLP